MHNLKISDRCTIEHTCREYDLTWYNVVTGAPTRKTNITQHKHKKNEIDSIIVSLIVSCVMYYKVLVDNI